MKRVACALIALFAVGAGRVAAADEVLVFATNPQGSLAFISAAAIAKVIDEKLKRQIRVQPTAGTSTFIPMLNRNEVNLGGINVEEIHAAYGGTGPFEGKPNRGLRIVSTLFPLPLGMVVAADSPARRIADLKGLRLPGGYAGQTTARTTQAALLANGGLGTTDVKEVPAINQIAGTEMLAAGRVDAASVTVGVSQVQKANVDLAARGGVRFLSIDTAPEAVARMQPLLRSRPVLFEPAAANVGIAGPTWVMGYSYYMVTSEATADALAYDLARVMHASTADLRRITPVFDRFDAGRMTERTDVPWHPGAVRFYTEIGQWPPKE